MQRKLQEQGFVDNQEIALRSKDGNEVIVSLSASLIEINNEKCLLSSFVDITELKRAQEALRQSQELFYKAFHSISFPVSLPRVADNHFVDANEAFLKLMGYNRDEVVGHTSKELSMFPNYSEREEFVRKLLRNESVNNQEIDIQTKNGKIIKTLFSVEMVEINGQPHMLTSLIDITEQKRLRKEVEDYTKDLESLVKQRTKELKDAERLAAIGATAGMVGHDIRNPLQAIVSDVFLIKFDMSAVPDIEEKEGIQESLDSIEKNISYINKIVQDLQDFAKALNPVAKEVDLSILCENILKNTNMPTNIEATCKVEKNANLIIADDELLRRVIGNLAINAVQAMPNGGKLDIYAYKQENDTVIEVKDTGMGIPEDAKPKLFTPLFTTKSKGQGFGLAVVKRVTESMNGIITFESQEGKGTKFIVRFPPPPTGK